MEARQLPVILAVLAISFGSYIHGTSIVFPDVRTQIFFLRYFVRHVALSYRYNERTKLANILKDIATPKISRAAISGQVS